MIAFFPARPGLATIFVPKFNLGRGQETPKIFNKFKSPSLKEGVRGGWDSCSRVQMTPPPPALPPQGELNGCYGKALKKDRRLARPSPENDWYFIDQGRGPNLLLLHGLGASSFSWRHNLGPLARHFRVLAPDLPPHGRSPAPLDGDYTVAGQIRGILEFLDRRGIEQAALAGNSLGGGLALLLARDYPERFPALVLLAPAVALTRVPYIFYPLRLPRLGRLAAASWDPGSSRRPCA